MAGIGFFAPLPLALMLPFMAGQSMLMGDAFGKSYQYGKRKISAMSNEEFNKLTPADLAQDITADFKALIPELEIAMQESRRFQAQILQEMGEIIKDLPQVIKDFFNFTGGENFGGDDTTDRTEGSIYDWIGKQWNNIFVSNLISGIGISTASSNYKKIKKHIENFLAGVGIMNQRIIDDARQSAKDFLANLTPPKKEKDDDKHDQIDREQDFTGRTKTVQEKINDAVNVTAKFWLGATSHRRQTQSSDKFLEKLKALVRNWFTYINLNKHDPLKLALGINGLRKQSQNVADWQFTYSL